MPALSLLNLQVKWHAFRPNRVQIFATIGDTAKLERTVNRYK